MAVVEEPWRRRCGRSEDAIGKCVRVNADTAPCTTVVGIAEDVRRGSLSEPEMHYYLPIDQFRAGRRRHCSFGPRDKRDRRAEDVRRALQPLMPGVSYVTVTPMATIIGRRTRSWKLGATMFTVFGALALVLAAIGLYSVIAYNVTQRTHEMGVRVALGAQRRRRHPAHRARGPRDRAAGRRARIRDRRWSREWIAPLLFDVSPKDPSVFAAVILTLVATSVAASWMPAMRAARVDPNEALRAD